MSGDIQNQYETMKKLLKKLDYKDQFSFEYVMDNNPTFFLRLLHYILVEYNPNFYKILVDNGYELYSKNDLRFTEQVFKLLQFEFNYKVQINIAQFLSEQYLEHKIIFVNDVIGEVQNRTKKDKKPNNIKGQENNPFQQNTQKQNQEIQNNKQKTPVYVQKENLQNFDEDDYIEEQPRRPEPYKKQESTNIEVIQKPPQKVQEQQYCGVQQQKPMKYSPQKDEQTIETVQQQKQEFQQLNQQLQNTQFTQSIQQQQITSFQIPQQTVTHQDLQKLMQVILISNENIKCIMQKFSELQTTVNIALANFDQRLTRLELKIRDQ